ncbi:zinc ribbon domain-containing protein [Gracilibacillus sp. YIM 98692]|uniref:zinc ribbon domain-containing protein n=1 Tax=Gracilibacillus sp. YIM 98692 TaxID=2663532 RepID=UPI001969ED7F|nr:zinc ribbon domain-containing protein [Gracilibacillus sp. YIM 98692]
MNWKTVREWLKIYYSREELDRLRKQGEKDAEEMALDKMLDKNGREYKSNDIQVTCIHCKHAKFGLGQAQLNTRGLTFMGLDWLNESVHTLICKRCGYIHWFSGEVSEIKE